MNFNSHHKSIKKLLLLPEKRKSRNPDKPDQNQFHRGIYVLSRDRETDKNNKLQYKIGMAHGAGGLYKRLGDYKICFPYPDEFYLHFIIITPSSEAAKKLERVILKERKMEAVKNPRNTLQNLEYRIVAKKATLHDALLKALRDNTKLWTHIMVFGEKGWKTLNNDGCDKIGSGVLSKPPNDMSKKPLMGEVKCFVEKERIDMMRATSKITDVKRKQPVNINTIKKGDLIRDKWGFALVQSVSKKKNSLTVASEQFPEGYTLFLH